MRNTNITKWADDLSATNLRQVAGVLARADDVVAGYGYCCLGFGCQISAPGITATPTEVDRGISQLLFGRERADGLAPIEFIEWLGYDTDEIPSGLVSSQYDVYFDFPTELRTRSHEDYNREHEGGDRDHDDHGSLMFNSVSASTLNDEGFSFAQIADIIRHFGLCDTVVPANPDRVTYA